MTERYSNEQIRAFWTRQAEEHGKAPEASWSDVRVMEMETREIAQHLAAGDRVLDVGCANGHSTALLAAHLPIQIRGIDYIPEMIAEANARLSELRDKLMGEIEFDVGDVLALSEKTASFDKVVSIRVIINLGTWERQLHGLAECARVLKPGGLLLLSEATHQGLQRLNKLREEWGLPAIPMPRFNCYLDEEKIVTNPVPGLKLVRVVNFASTYFVGTRVIKPLLSKLSGKAINVADPKMEFNRWLAEAPAWGDYGTQKLLIFQKE